MAGQQPISLKIPSRASNNRKNLIFIGHQKKELPNSTVPKFVETGRPLLGPAHCVAQRQEQGSPACHRCPSFSVRCTREGPECRTQARNLWK